MVNPGGAGMPRWLLPVTVLVIGIVVPAVYMIERGLFSRVDGGRTTAVDPEVETEAIRTYSAPIRTVVLYFSDTQAERLVPETREVAGVHDPAELVKLLVQELESGPMGGLAPTLPGGTSLRHVFSDAQGTFYLDFEPAIVADHPGGTRAELLTLRSIAETIGANVPGVRDLRILVGGEEMLSIAGHLDARAESLVAGQR